MIAVPSRHRSLTLLGVVLTIQILLLAVQIRRDSKVRLIRVWTVELLSPIQRAGAWTIDLFKGGWGGYIALHHTRQQNLELQSELDQMRLQNQQLEGRAAEADRLARLLGFRQSHTDVPMLAAQVIGASPDPGSHILYLDRGSRDGVKRDMGVITPDGVVGKILAVYYDTSQVLVLNDKDSGVGALLANTRTQGPVKGTGDPLLDMEYVSSDEKIAPGEAVLTSGQDRIFPKDLPVGYVVQSQPDAHSPFMNIRVRPAAHLDQLEEVLILLTRQELNLSPGDQSSPAAPASPSPSASAPAASPGSGEEPATAPR
jgi:rod shape-determining protein MreC